MTIIYSCTKAPELTDADKKQVETEIQQFMQEFMPEDIEPMNPETMFSYFIQSEDLAIASGGVLLTNPLALQKQRIKDIDNKIYVINKDAAVISTSKLITITFKEGGEITIPVALTILLVKKEGNWKIVHYHN